MSDPNHVNGFDISRYAPPPHAEIVAKQTAFIQSHFYGTFDEFLPCRIDAFMKARAPKTPLTGQMFLASRDNPKFYIGNPGLWLMLALIQQDSMFGTKGEGADLHNPGNLGDDDEGHTRDYGTWQNGVDAVAEWLSRHRVPASETR